MYGVSAYASVEYSGLLNVPATKTATFTTDAGVKTLKNPKTFTTDGVVQTGGIKFFSTDGIVLKRTTKTFTTDAVVALLNVPDITFRQAVSPYALVTSLNYQQTKDDDGIALPVKEDETSDTITFRIYNNWALNKAVTSIFNVQVAAYDNLSFTALTPPIAQEWIVVQETGYGEGTSQPGNVTFRLGQPTAIGGSDKYTPERGSDGSTSALINGSEAGGLGFIEIQTYAQVPAGASTAIYTPVIVVFYDYEI